MLNALGELKEKLNGYRLSVVKKLDYDPVSQKWEPEYCIIISELNAISVSHISIEKAAEELIRGCPALAHKKVRVTTHSSFSDRP